MGSPLDDFLASEGILEEVEEVAAKRVSAFLQQQALKNPTSECNSPHESREDLC